MTLPLAGSVIRRFAALTVAFVLPVFAGVAAAGADTDDTEGATAEDSMPEVEVLDDVIEDTDDDADSSVASAQATSDEACTPMLVTHRADGSSGDEQAVAITAQAQEFGVEGWVNVAWQASEGAQLTALTIIATDGTVMTRTSNLQSGSAIDVRELRFCGSDDGERLVDAGPPPSEERDDTATEDGDEADDGDDATDEDDELFGVVTVPTPENGNGDDDAGDAAATVTATEADESETEVLGVQLTQDSSPDPGGGLATALGLLLLAVVAGGGAFLGFRRLRA